MKEWVDKTTRLSSIRMQKNFLAKEGYDQAYGARPIKRAIQKYVEDAVADAILDGMLKEGGTYTVSKDKKEAKLVIK